MGNLISYLLRIDDLIFNLINTGMSNRVFDAIIPWIPYLGHFWAGWVFIIVLILINWRAILRGLRLGLFSSLIYGCTFGIFHPIKYLVNRPRPFMAHEAIVRVPLDLPPFGPTDPSFPSGGTAVAFMIAAIASSEIKSLRKYKFILYGVACLVGFSRVYTGTHYLTDVIVGALIGYGVTKFMLSNKFLRTHLVEKEWRRKNGR